MFSNLFPENLGVGVNVEKFCSRTGHRRQYNMRSAQSIPQVTDTNSEYIILITLPLQQWLYERDSTLRYTYSTLPVLFLFICEWFIQQRRNYVTSNGWIRVNWKSMRKRMV